MKFIWQSSDSNSLSLCRASRRSQRLAPTKSETLKRDGDEDFMLSWLISRWYSGFMCCSCCVWNVCLCSPLAVKMWSDESSRDKTTTSRRRKWTKASWEPKTNGGASHAQTQQSKNVFSTSSCTKITFQSTLDTSDLEDSWEFRLISWMQKKVKC